MSSEMVAAYVKKQTSSVATRRPATASSTWKACGAVLGVAAVFAGARFEVSGFCIQSGFRGTGWLDDVLYAIGNDTVALAVVAVIWFVYGASISGMSGQRISAFLCH